MLIKLPYHKSLTQYQFSWQINYETNTRGKSQNIIWTPFNVDKCHKEGTSTGIQEGRNKLNEIPENSYKWVRE